MICTIDSYIWSFMPYKNPLRQKEYHKKYRELNKEKIKQSKKRYYELNKKLINAKTKIYAASRKEIKAEYDRNRRIEKRDEILCKKREYYQANRTKIREEQAKYRIKNKEKINSTNREYYKKNKEILKIKQKQYHQKNKKHIYEKSVKYKLKNKEKLNAKRREWYKEKTKKDMKYKLSRNYRSIVRSYCLKQSTRKKGKTFDLLGCSGLEFKLYLENLWEPWMNWENYGVHKANEKRWQIDHIIPVSHFDLNDIDQAKKAFNYKNCRPLCSKQNITEGNKR